MKMEPTPTIEEIDRKVNAILDMVLPMLKDEHVLIHGLVAAELTAAFIMKHPAKLRKAIAQMQYGAVFDVIEGRESIR